MGFDVLSPVGIRMAAEGAPARTTPPQPVSAGDLIGVLENSGRGHSIDADEVRAAINAAIPGVSFLNRRKPNRSFELQPDGIREFATCAAVVCATAE